MRHAIMPAIEQKHSIRVNGMKPQDFSYSEITYNRKYRFHKLVITYHNPLTEQDIEYTIRAKSEALVNQEKIRYTQMIMGSINYTLWLNSNRMKG
jgi:hypothetical protein